MRGANLPRMQRTMEAARTHGVEASLLKEAEAKAGLVERVQAEAELRDAMRGGDLLVLQRALAEAKKRGVDAPGLLKEAEDRLQGAAPAQDNDVGLVARLVQEQLQASRERQASRENYMMPPRANGPLPMRPNGARR